MSAGRGRGLRGAEAASKGVGVPNETIDVCLNLTRYMLLLSVMWWRCVVFENFCGASALGSGDECTRYTRGVSRGCWSPRVRMFPALRKLGIAILYIFVRALGERG